VSLVVGGLGNQSGEFVLILEGMAVTDSDGTGDFFEVNVTPGMVASGVRLSVYMITRGQSSVDPLLYVADANDDPLTDSNGDQIYCNNAGDSSNCYTPMDLSASTVSIESGNLTTWNEDAELSLDLTGLTLNSDRTQNYLTYVMTSYRHQTRGQYLLAFHIGTTENVKSGGTLRSGGGNGSNGGSNGGSSNVGGNGNGLTGGSESGG